MKKIALIGMGGLGKEIAAYISKLSSDIEIVGYFDDERKESELKYLGSLKGIKNEIGCEYILSLSNPLVKSSLQEKIQVNFLDALVYGKSFGNNNKIGKGSIICPGAILTTDIEIGKHCLINLNSTIGHDVEIGDFSSVMPGVNISGNVRIGKKVLIGTGAQVLQGVRIGDGAVVGAGAVVTKDVRDDVTVVGVPARAVGSSSGSWQ